MAEVVCVVLQVYLLVIFARIVLSWFPPSSGGGLRTVQEILYTLTEPLLGPLRSVLPPVQLGAAALDLSPMVVVFGLMILRGFICG